MRQFVDAVIVGAGISGLVLAHRLREKKKSVIVIEKSRSVGGRMATRRDGAAAYDHGAQFYKIQSNEIFSLDQLWSRFGYVRDWVVKENTILRSAETGINNLAKVLALDLDILLNQKIVKVSEIENKNVELMCETGIRIISKRVYLTMPLPQALDLLKRSEIEYPLKLETVTYAQALVGMFEIVSSSQNIRDLRYIENASQEVFSISNQLSKKVSSVLSFTVVMNSQWSRDHFDKSDDDILYSIKNIFNLHLCHFDADFKIIKQQIKKWRYSHPNTQYTDPAATVGREYNIILLGDAFGGGSIRGAVRSAEWVQI